ncbi:hypothetical protein BGZ98_003475, partial [Dissophora globulifera]
RPLLRRHMDSHGAAPGAGAGAGVVHGIPPAAAPLSHDSNSTSPAGLQRRAKPPHFPYPNPNLTARTAFMQWDDSEMKRTASYSSFLSKKSGSFYKPMLQHARAGSGPVQPPDMYSTSPEDSLPTTLTKTPTYEYYGFVLYLVSGITYAMYLGWAYLPKEVLDSMGITYYPSKYWSLALPVWLFVLVIYLYVAFFAINLYNTEPFDSFLTITDEHANPFQTINSASSLTDDFVPDLMDIPIGMVNACLYQHIEGISDEDEDGDEGDEDMYDDDDDFLDDDEDDDEDDDDDDSYFDDTRLADWQ